MELIINSELSQRIEDIDFSGSSAADSELVKAILLLAHPVGSYYWSEDSTNPADLFGGTWEAIKDRFILAAGDDYEAGNTGGSAYLQSHTHDISVSINSGGASHSHSIPALSGTAASSSHMHVVTTKTTSYASGSQTNWRCLSWQGTSADYTQTVYTNNGYADGSHTHDVTTNASTTGATTPSHTHSSSATASTTGSGNAENMPPYIVAYCWKRTA